MILWQLPSLDSAAGLLVGAVALAAVVALVALFFARGRVALARFAAPFLALVPVVVGVLLPLAVARADCRRGSRARRGGRARRPGNAGRRQRAGRPVWL